MTANGEPRIRVFLVEDHQLVREGLRVLLRDDEGIELVGEAADGLEALDQLAALAVDVLVIDVGLPGLSGIEVVRRLRGERPGLPALMLSMHDDRATIDQALRAGARGYVLKGQGVGQLREAIRIVSRGEVFLSPTVSEYVLEGYLSGDGAEEELLSDREREVLCLVAEGYTARQIAKQLGLKPKTVENHRTRIMDKLGIRTIAGLVRYAIHTGVIR